MTGAGLARFCLAATLACAMSALADGGAPLAQAFRNAPRMAKPESAPILAAAVAGRRVVAVGDHGAVVLSDDGRKFRQAKQVPTRAVLTSVFFLDADRGWAAGHDGTVIGTTDGGETWSLLREEPGRERALLSLWFQDAQRGLAVGQFGLALATEDGGRTWRERRLAEAEAGEKHLLHVFSAGDGLLFVAAEAGAVFRSEDNGARWALVQTDNKGSFWTGLALKGGVLLVAGLRGHIYRSEDRGHTWKEGAVVTQESITSIVQRADGSVRLAGLSGTLLTSRDEGRSFEGRELASRTSITAIAEGPSGELLFSLTGLVTGK